MNTDISTTRNTAVVASSVVERSVGSLIGPTVQDGDQIFGFDPFKPENEELVYAVDGEATREPLQHLERPFLIKAWHAKRINLPDTESGESVPCIRVTLIDPDHETLSFVSFGIVQSLDLIRTLKGDGPYNPPLPMVVVALKTRRGFNTFKLRPFKPQQAGN